jgi:hypothetical protein
VAVQSGELANSKIIEPPSLEPTRLKNGRFVQAAVVETIVFPGFFSICVVSVTGILALFVGFNVCRPAELRRDASQSKGDLPALVVVVTPAETVLTCSI